MIFPNTHMAQPATKKKKLARTKDKDTDSDGLMDSLPLQADTIRGVWGVLLVALAVFLAITPFGLGGVVGSTLYDWLTLLFGVGYALVPLSVVIAAIVLFRSIQGKLGVLKLVSAAFFLVAALGLVNITFPGRAGIFGSLISQPLVAGIDVPATVVFLLAFIMISLLIAFDAHPGIILSPFRWLFSNDETEPEVADVEPIIKTGLPEAQPAEEPTPEAETPAPESEPKTRFWKKDKPVEELPIINAPGVKYVSPPLSILNTDKGKPGVGDVKGNTNIIKRTLQNFGITVEMDEVSIGPTVTRYAMKPAEGVRLAKIVALQSNLELALAASPVRIEAPIPGKSLVGIEVPNTSRTTLGLASLLSESTFTQSDKPLLVALGRDIAGQPNFQDLARAPHLLVAGTTGAGKSVTIHDLIVSLLYRRGPDQLRFVMIDPKRVELTLYNSIPHLLTPVITDAKKAILAFKWLAKEMDRRYDVLEAESVRDISSYHTNILAPAIAKHDPNPGPETPKPPEQMPYIVVFVDELADLMQAYPRELEAGIVRLAQMSRAVGIHLVLSTQRPSVKVITGLIKANVPARLALQVASQIDSRTILDMGGAEKLLGAGDMLFLSGEMSKPKRIQAPYLTEKEVKKVVEFLSETHENHVRDEIDFTENDSGAAFSASLGGDDDGDDLLQEAERVVVEAKKASTSFLQRKLRVGYSRAARLIDLLEERGVIGPGDGAKPREVIGAMSIPETTDETA
jgi:S-DNA-T family DNA segregation ATPase FtsK/SpoIIIE